MFLDYKFYLLQAMAYLCGSIPFGLIISKIFKNIDIRQHGSHNIGATNVTRTLGKKWGALVLLLDGIKALLPILIIKKYYSNAELILAITTISVIFGHIFSIWLKFKGGKGIACILFALFALNIKLGILFLVSWILMFAIFRISALSALTAVIITLIASFFVSKIYFFMMLLLGVIIFYKHKDNIKRIINKEQLKNEK